MLNHLTKTLKMVNFHHSIFALPFALSSAFLAAKELPETVKLILIVVAMVSARSAAMAFNRIVDIEIDRKNPRTQNRELPAGKLTISFAIFFTLICSALFFFSAYLLNKTCFMLSPIVLLILMGYSFTKRFTLLCHFILGLSLSLGSVGAWIAINESVDKVPLIIGFGVLFWVAGFDIIYSLMDVEFDKTNKIYSIAAILGVKRALFISLVCHILAGLLLGSLIFLIGLGSFYIAGTVIVAFLLIYQHIIVTPSDFKRANEAFFYVNAIISVVYMCAVFLEVLIK